MSVYLLCTLDTKGAEAEFVRQQLRRAGVDVTLVDTGCLGRPTVEADITREQVMAAGGESLEQLAAAGDRGRAVTAAAAGAAQLTVQAMEQGRLQGVMALGGSAGTTIAAAAMRRLPLGVPKLIVSTLASGNVRPYVGDKDVLMLNSVVDIAGVNRISRLVLHNASAAMAGMVKDAVPRQVDNKPLIAATMFGVTTPCVQRARRRLEQAGYEVLVFHATGNGGQAMESLIDEGLIAGVLDITTTELADELVGGVLSAGPHRLEAAARRGVPQLVSVGALDMVNFGPLDSVPQRFRDSRRLYQHNDSVTLMRTTAEECRQLGAWIAEKASASAELGKVLLPTRGLSAIDAPGQPFDDPQAREALFQAIERQAGPLSVQRIDAHINDEAFADAAADALLELIAAAAARKH